MNLSRRQFTVSTLLLSLELQFGFTATGSQRRAFETGTDAEFTQAFDALQQKISAFLKAARYQQISTQPLITGHAFNGGLRYDDSGVLTDTPNGEMVVQGCARIVDIPLKGRRGVLPFFHILACNRRSATDRGETVSEAFDFFTATLGFAVQRLALVSLSTLEDYRDQLVKRGIDWERQVVIRDAEEAKAAGDGSGYFKPVDHPEQPEEITVGFYVWTGGDRAPAVKTYPLPEPWIEIGEVSLDKTSALAYGFGLERIVYAKTGLFPSWQEQCQHLLKKVETESRESSVPLPRGYYLFKASSD